MERFIGTKIVHAEPVENNGKAGYRVVYGDGYESWSPAEAFEEAYRQADAMPFGLALEAVKKGKKVARKGWNGKDMYLFLGTMVQLETYADIADIRDSDGNGTALVNPSVIMKTANSELVVGWLASQTDMLSDDWYIVD